MKDLIETLYLHKSDGGIKDCPWRDEFQLSEKEAARILGIKDIPIGMSLIEDNSYVVTAQPTETEGARAILRRGYAYFMITGRVYKEKGNEQ